MAFITWQLTLGDAIVGAGTLALAAFTYVLATSTGKAVAQSQAELRLLGQQAEDATRPIVVPAPSAAWLDKLSPYQGNLWVRRFPVRNVGPRVALNVTGRLDFGPPSGVSVNLLTTTLGAGDDADLLVDWAGTIKSRWDSGLSGRLEYEDMDGTLWVTDFLVEPQPSERVRIVVNKPCQATAPIDSASVM